jgi:hypothetical protein
MLAHEPAVTKTEIAPAVGEHVQRAVELRKTGFALPIWNRIMEYYGGWPRRLRGWTEVSFHRWCKLHDVPKAFDLMTRPRLRRGRRLRAV